MNRAMDVCLKKCPVETHETNKVRLAFLSTFQQVLAAVPSFAQGFAFELVSGLSKLTLGVQWDGKMIMN